MQSDAQGNQVIDSGKALPLVIAVTGHRDLVESETGAIRKIVRTFFTDLQARYPSTRLAVMSALAEGADTLVAEIALDMSLDLIVPLPKPVDSYLADFHENTAREKFHSLFRQATDSFILPNSIPPAPAGIDADKWQADYPYAQLGIYLSAHCHILLAIWDGNNSRHLGGTAQVVSFHHDDVMPGITSRTTASLQNLVDDESDLVFHITCTRVRTGPRKQGDSTAPDWFWFTKDPDNPRSKDLPAQHDLIFRRIGEFYQDINRFEPGIESMKASLLEHDLPGQLPAGIGTIDRYFGYADWLAIHFQRLTLKSLVLLHVMALLMGLMFILYSDVDSNRVFLVAFVFAFGLAWVAQAIAGRGAWHRKYLDYRTLAEGLRIQLYWAIAGVSSEKKWRFTHDSYLQSQNPEFGWIRNVMRVTGARTDADRYAQDSGLAFALREWIGDVESGQLGYFRKKARERGRYHRVTRSLGVASLVTSIMIVLGFLFLGSSIPGDLAVFLKFMMGTMLLLFAVREGFAHATAEKELIKQYEYMLGIYESAQRRIGQAADSNEKREVLRALGQSALNEHSSWILMHRERSPDQGEIWRMGS